MSNHNQVVIIGAGLGGLSAAIHLAIAGKRVLVLEQNPQVGGKMGEVRQDGFRWDTGPSVITMRHVLEDLFTSAGRSLRDYLDLKPVKPLTRYFYPDGVVLDASRNFERMAEQIKRIEPRDVDGYRRFLEYAERLHHITGRVFIYDRPPGVGSLLRVPPVDILRVDGLRTMSQAIEGFVRSPHLRQLLGRFATYVGASPFLAPATLNVIAHMELNQGVWYPPEGLYSIAQAYARLAQELGVQIETNCPVAAIDLNRRSIAGVTLAGGRQISAAAVVANVDVATVYAELLPPHSAIKRRARLLWNRRPSCSGYILLLGVRGQRPELAHHNIFFSSDYPQEFEQIFRQGIPPEEPTIYVAITVRSTPEDAPPGHENWFVLVNAPALGSNWDWQTQGEAYANRVLELLSRRGHEIRPELVVKQMLTPEDLERLTGAHRGALYGASSNNRWAAFRRPHNRATDLDGLYFAGGTTHPGGGVPMVTLSGKVASQLLLEDGF